jgi:uncharacterized protein (DUF488 family)
LSDEVTGSNETASVVTVGHSNRDRQSLVDLLTSHEVTRLIDVRRYPNSRRNPQFNQGNLEHTLPEAGITYEHWPEIGGYRDARNDSPNTALENGFRGVADYLNTETGQEILEQLENRILETEGLLSLMCAEKDPDRCHRQLISDHLTVRDHEVLHLLSKEQSKPHELHPNARLKSDSVTYPGLI